MVNRAPLDILFGIEIKGSGEQQSYTKKELCQGMLYKQKLIMTYD